MSADLSAKSCDEATARALTLALRQSLTVSCDLLVEAYERRAWAALGYESWRAYTDTELGEVRLRLPREQRRELVATMTEAGMSTRAIGSALGVDQKTVVNDRREELSSPDEPADDYADLADASEEQFETAIQQAQDDGDLSRDHLADKIAAELAASDEHYAERVAPPRITGTDGKSYPAPPQPSQAVTDFLDSGQDVQDARYVHNFHRAFTRSDDFLSFDPERLAQLLDSGEVESIDMYAASVARFADTLRRARTGLRVISGGNR